MRFRPLALFFVLTSLPVVSVSAVEMDKTRMRRLEKGEVLRRLEPISGSEHRRGIAQGVIDASPERIVELLLAAGEYAEFMPSTEISQVRNRPDDGVVYYAKLDMAWPAEDVEYECDLRVGEGRRHLTFSMVPGTGKGVKTFEGSWTLEPLAGANNRTLATYELIFVPDAWYPSWVVRVAINATLGKVIQAIRKRIDQKPSSPPLGEPAVRK